MVISTFTLIMCLHIFSIAWIWIGLTKDGWYDTYLRENLAKKSPECLYKNATKSNETIEESPIQKWHIKQIEENKKWWVDETQR